MLFVESLKLYKLGMNQTGFSNMLVHKTATPEMPLEFPVFAKSANPEMPCGEVPEFVFFLQSQQNSPCNCDVITYITAVITDKPQL